MYSSDVVELILSFLERIMMKDKEYVKEMIGESFNISFDQEITLFELMRQIADIIGVEVKRLDSSILSFVWKDFLFLIVFKKCIQHILLFTKNKYFYVF